LDDDLDDTELENIGLHIDGVDDAMLAAMSPEKVCHDNASSICLTFT
jgi:hypothetical protein